jgi:hypothetical protein
MDFKAVLLMDEEIQKEGLYVYTYIHTYRSRFIPEGVAEASQIFIRDTHVLPKLVYICI